MVLREVRTFCCTCCNRLSLNVAAWVPAAGAPVRLFPPLLAGGCLGDDPGHPAHGSAGAVGRPEVQPTAAIIDSQSVKTTEAGGPRGVRRRQKVNGRKRHLLTDTSGLPLRLVVHPASIQDRDGLGLVCARIRRRFPWLAPVRRCRLPGDVGLAVAGRGKRWLRLEIVGVRGGEASTCLPPRRCR